MEKTKRRRRQRQSIDLNQLKGDPNSFLSWGIEDVALRKLETYRLYQVGYTAADIAEAFGMSREYLYQLWREFKAEGTVRMVNKHWGSEPRKRTSEVERQVLRNKAMEPELGDSELGHRFGLDRTTVYHLLKEHGLQDLHRVLNDNEETESTPSEKEDGEKKGSKSSPVRKHST